jgi:hypothetical protein
MGIELTLKKLCLLINFAAIFPGLNRCNGFFFKSVITKLFASDEKKLGISGLSFIILLQKKGPFLYLPLKYIC